MQQGLVIPSVLCKLPPARQLLPLHRQSACFEFLHQNHCFHHWDMALMVRSQLLTNQRDRIWNQQGEVIEDLQYPYKHVQDRRKLASELPEFIQYLFVNSFDLSQLVVEATVFLAKSKQLV